MLGKVIHRDEVGFLKTNDLMFHRFSNINELDRFALIELILEFLDRNFVFLRLERWRYFGGSGVCYFQFLYLSFD